RQPAMAKYNSGEISPGPATESDEDILDWVANDAETALHPCCTTKMGPDSDPMSVVDPTTKKVHGLENVRVADASAMPYSTNGNIHAPALMVAEKAADLTLRKVPVDPSNLELYRHEQKIETLETRLIVDCKNPGQAGFLFFTINPTYLHTALIHM